MVSVSVHNPHEFAELDFQALKAAARAVLEGEGVRDAKVTLAFLDNPSIHALNKRHLDHDEPTDVITFPYSGPGAKKLEGDVAIGYDVAKTQAAERGHPLNTELTLYVIHGCLHLCGYDDRTEKAAREMRRKERDYLAKLGLPDISGE
jgi:probable rRNA maturation factor